MASAAASAATAAGVFSLGTAGAVAGVSIAVPIVGWAVGIAAALIDTYYIMPALQGKKRENAREPRLLDTPVGSNVPGAPRVWAIGVRVRVPTHILWQDTKVRQTQPNSTKAGTGVQQRKVFIDAMVALNDRPTRNLVQLVGNGKLLLYQSRNFVTLTSSRMTASVVSSRLRLTAASTLDPDFKQYFAVGDYVFLRNFTGTSAAQVNAGYWKVHAVTEHTASPSTIDVTPKTGQSLASFSATAGSIFAPAIVTREDTRVFVETTSILIDASGGPGFESYFAQLNSNGHISNTRAILQHNGQSLAVVLDNFAPDAAYGNATINGNRTVSWFSGQTTSVNWTPPYQTYGGPAPQVAPPAGQTATVQRQVENGFTQGVFLPTYNPAANFYSGSETQAANPVLAAELGAANVPAYRGVSYQVLDDFFATQFGDALPYSMEAIIEVDESMDWGRAVQTILTDRAQLPVGSVDVTGITQRAFLGMYLRGPIPANTALQPLLVAGQMMVQDRDGVLTFTEFQNADEVAIENGIVFSNFGTRLDGERAADDKWTVEDVAVEDLPTKIGVRHQDPDNQYADGYQFFGLRNPEGVDHTNEQELDLSQMVLTRQEAANLAATVLRRSWVNRRTYRFVLPAAYIDLLESDLLTWTDDEGVDHVARIIQRDIGSDFRVGITAIAEDLDLAVAGSPVQSAAGSVPQLPGAAAGLDVVIVDGPAYLEGQNRRPGLQIAIGTYGGNWSGAAIYESVDGTTYDLVDVVGKRATTGTLDTTLPSGQVAEYVGMTGLGPDAGSCTVTVTSFGASQMTSRTAKEVFSGLNWCALVKPDGTVEIAAFTSVTALGDNQFTLSGWLRGLRGTGNPYGLTVNEAPAGTRFVLLNGETYFREFSGEITPPALSYKIVPAGLGLEDVEQINVVSARRNALPLPVRTLTKTIDPVTFDARLTVTHNWCRAVLPLGTQPPHPMDEPLEAYRFTIYDTAGKQVRRVKTITASGTGSNTIRDRWIDYPASEQSADGYTPGASTLFTVDVQQIGEFGLGPSVIRKF